ncbi:MAG: ribonuclease Y [Clostridiales bacterium]|nr:ribonuclease Y [Candidatus Apopatousia equi]
MTGITNSMLALLEVPVWVAIIFIVVGLASGVVCGYYVDKHVTTKKLGKAKNTANKIIEEAYVEVKTTKKEALLETKEEIQKLKTEADEEVRLRRLEVQKLEDRAAQKEEYLNKKEEQLDKRQVIIDETKQKQDEKEKELENGKLKLAELENKAREELEKVSGMSKEEAKRTLISTYEEEAKIDAVKIVRNIEQQAIEEGDKKARHLITQAIQRYAADQTSEVTVSTVALPSDEMKGRIIGREGRNIRALEQATGVDFIIDDTPESIVISGFDPVRREVARQTLEKLILDGRIHPARIEEMVEKVQRDIDQTIKEAGENAAYDADVHGIHPELLKVLGRLKYRTSYGQNVLKHSLEVCHIAGALAAELGADVKIAKRGGLLHDIGKAIDQETEGTHVSIGVELTRKYHESEEVIHCIEAHHGGVEYKSIEAMIVQAADAISSARPGARRENLENYIKRLTQLEEIANGFKGVEKSFAIQAGREVRIIVKPEEIKDEDAEFLARDIARKIEDEMQYPGQIKVNVIREWRSVDYAK